MLHPDVYYCITAMMTFYKYEHWLFVDIMLLLITYFIILYDIGLNDYDIIIIINGTS